MMSPDCALKESMGTPQRGPRIYNRIAGQSVERLAALSEGIFAVSMTLLVLDLRLDPGEPVAVGATQTREPLYP